MILHKARTGRAVCLSETELTRKRGFICHNVAQYCGAYRCRSFNGLVPLLGISCRILVSIYIKLSVLFRCVSNVSGNAVFC